MILIKLKNMLNKLFDFLFYNCRHDWEVFHKGNLMTDNQPTGIFYHLRCKKCGEMKSKNLR